VIGGDDVIIKAPQSGPEGVLVFATRRLQQRWGQAVIQDAETGELFLGSWDIPFSKIKELMIYRDRAAFHRWAEEGAVEATANSMIHLIAEPSEVTIVVDDKEENVARDLIASLQEFVEAHEILNEQERKEAA
jgi:hypothetical protein